MECSCKADSGHTCKHIYVFCYIVIGDLNTLEKISSTDKECMWKMHKKPVLEQFEAQPLRTFCCVNQKPLPIIGENIEIGIRKRLIKCNNETAIAKHNNRNLNGTRIPLQPIENEDGAQDFVECIIRNSTSLGKIAFLKELNPNFADCCHNTYNNKIVCNNVLETARATRVCKTQWQKARQFRITGSRCYSLYTYAKDNWSEKACNYFWAKKFTNKFTTHGNKYESVARNVYSKEANVFVQECDLIVSQSEPWMTYSPDGVIIENSDTFRLLEIKCPYDLENTIDNTLLKKNASFYIW